MIYTPLPEDKRRRPARRITDACLFLSVVFVGGCVDIRLQDPNVRYVAFGDSTTAGPSERNYPDIVRELLGEETKSFANEGRSGENAEDGLVRLRSLIDGDIFPNANVLLYWQGGNDVTDFIKDNDRFLLWSPSDEGYPFADELDAHLGETQQNIESAIAAARDTGWEVYAATYFPILETLQICDALPFDLLLPGQASNANDYLVRLNQRIRAAADEQNAVLVDVAAASEIGESSANYHDCNHLSEQGNEIAAGLFLDAIGRR